jgi:hypothetical protein
MTSADTRLFLNLIKLNHAPTRPPPAANPVLPKSACPRVQKNQPTTAAFLVKNQKIYLVVGQIPAISKQKR